MFAKTKPITGHLVDSAGNTLPGISVEVRMVTPSGSIVVDSLVVNGNGYFVTKPLPDGDYNFYHSGVFVTSRQHRLSGTIPVYASQEEYIDSSIIKEFSVYADEQKASEFKVMLQIDENEPTHILATPNAVQGITPPNEITAGFEWLKGDLSYAASFFQLGSEGKFTTSRYNIEYFFESQSSSRKIRSVQWSGVPGIKYTDDSPILLPIDYFSWITRVPYASYIEPVTNDAAEFEWLAKGILKIKIDGFQNPPGGDNGSAATELFTQAPLGTVVKMINGAQTIEGAENNRVWQKYWIGILYRRSSTEIWLEPLRSSRYMDEGTINNPVENLLVSEILGGTPADEDANFKTGDYLYMQLFDGMLSSMLHLTDDVNMRFSVTRCPLSDIMLQNGSEMYTYEYSQEVLSKLAEE